MTTDTLQRGAAQVRTIDVRSVVPRQRHALIFSTFRSLAAGDALELVNDHAPLPLYHQFQAEMPDGFSWDDIETGPDIWRVRITRLATTAASHAAGSCCGACGGA